MLQLLGDLDAESPGASNPDGVTAASAAAAMAAAAGIDMGVHASSIGAPPSGFDSDHDPFWQDDFDLFAMRGHSSDDDEDDEALERVQHPPATTSGTQSELGTRRTRKHRSVGYKWSKNAFFPEGYGNISRQ